MGSYTERRWRLHRAVCKPTNIIEMLCPRKGWRFYMKTIEEAITRIKELNDESYIEDLKSAGLIHHAETLESILKGDNVQEVEVLALHNLMVDAQGDDSVD